MSSRHALVTGATGYIGAALVPALLEAGWTVRASGRREAPDSIAGDLREQFSYVPADLAAGTPGDGQLAELLDGVSHVFHLAGASSSKSSDAEMEHINRTGTACVVAAARAAGVQRVVHMSSTSIYGEAVQLPSPVTEDVTPQPSRSYGKAKLGAEEEVRAAAAAGLDTVILRPVTVYGPGAVKLLASAILDVAIEHHAGLDTIAIPAESVEQRLLHLDDLLAATLHVATQPDAAGQTYNVVADSYPTSHEIAGVIAEAFGLGTTPEAGEDIGLPYAQRVRRRELMREQGMTDDIILSPQRFRFLGKANINNRLSTAALEATGFSFAHTDWASSVRDNIDWYRAQRWII